MTEQEALEVLEALLTYDLSLDEEIAVDMGIKALEKQIAKKPIWVEKCDMDACPICKSLYARQVPYCSDCGQKLDWGNEDAE